MLEGTLGRQWDAYKKTIDSLNESITSFQKAIVLNILGNISKLEWMAKGNVFDDWDFESTPWNAGRFKVIIKVNTTEHGRVCEIINFYNDEVYVSLSNSEGGVEVYEAVYNWYADGGQKMSARSAELLLQRGSNEKIKELRDELDKVRDLSNQLYHRPE